MPSDPPAIDLVVPQTAADDEDLRARRLDLSLLPALSSDRTRQRIAAFVAESREIRQISREIRQESGRARAALQPADGLLLYVDENPCT